MKEYEYIVEDIKEQIIAGKLSAHDKLPSIKAMTEVYHVSTITVRKSLEILSNEGYIETKERSGCYVKDSENDLFYMYFNEITNIKETILNAKILSVAQIYDFNSIEDIQKDSKANTVKIRRTFHTYLDAPVSYDIKYLQVHIPKISSRFSQADNFKRLDQFLEKEIDKELEIRLIKPTAEVSATLMIPENTPVFYFKQKYFDKHHNLIALGQTYTIAGSVKVRASSMLGY